MNLYEQVVCTVSENENSGYYLFLNKILNSNFIDGINLNWKSFAVQYLVYCVSVKLTNKDADGPAVPAGGMGFSNFG